jgi:phage repressor protein C with HTH and peptisase S24 domain
VTPPLKIFTKLAEMGYAIPGLTTGIVGDLKNQGVVTDADIAERRSQNKTFDPEKSIDDYPPLSKTIKKHDFVIPLLDQKLSAGNGQYIPDKDTPTGYIKVPKYLSQYGKNLAALYVDGDSMEPTLSRGDLIVCDSCGWDGDGIYAIQVDGCGYVKRLSRQPGKIVVISDNPKYNQWDEPSDSEALRIIGRVHCVLKIVK